MTANPAPAAVPSPDPEWDLFHRLLPAKLLNDLDPRAPQAAYTPFVVTWLLLFQRLNGNATLNDAVGELLFRFPQQALPDCKKARDQSLSANSGAYGRARGDLDVRVLYFAFDNLYDSLLDTYPTSYRGRRAFIFDGSTVQLAPTLPLRVAYPPASNQHGSSCWPILHLAVAHELQSGLAVFPEFGPMFGPAARSELSLSRGLLARLPKRSIALGDRNFGVFFFAWAAAQEGHDALLRLTKPRFESLRKKARQVGKGKWELTWRPSAWDRRAHPELPQKAEVAGWLYEVKVSAKLTLWLFATMDDRPEQMGALYHKRQDVETDIRDLKETLLLGRMKGKGVEMVEKELVAAMLAYNLANQVRRLAAARLQVEPRRLSFAGTWSLLKAFASGLLEGKTGEEAVAEFERLLKAAGQRLLPERPEGRSYPRAVLPRTRSFPPRKIHKKPPPSPELK
jgi:Transposase DDE domain